MLGISLGLGLLVGLQREWQDEPVAGVRTFALITLLGTVIAMLADTMGGWVLAAGIIGVVGTVAVGTTISARKGKAKAGITTEIATVLMFGIGALLVVAPWSVAVALGGAVAVLLQWKQPLHRLIDQLGDKEVRAIMQFALISLVILPVLPDETFGPLDVWNPRNIWWMVVLITGISLGAYIAFKAFGEHVGMVLGGLLGGFISSTATTVSFSRRAHARSATVLPAAFVIILASTVMYARVLVEITVVAPQHLQQMVWPIAILAAASIVMVGIVWFLARRTSTEFAEPENPTELKSALFFGAMYAVVLLGVAAAEEYFGQRGIYAVALLSGLTDMDAITLSSARMVADGRVAADTAWRAIILAALSNLTFKLGMILVLAGVRLARWMAAFLLISAMVSAALMLFWPG